jgi:hypothetical protein
MSCPAHDDDKWDAYPNTVLEFLDAARTRVDLRRPVGDAERAALARLGLGGPFAVFTAENPCGENVDDQPTPGEAAAQEARNERRTSRLERDLLARGVPFVQVDGAAPDGSYRERCVAVLMPRDEATRMAERFEQLALFWFDGRDFWLLAARLDEPPRRLP